MKRCVPALLLGLVIGVTVSGTVFFWLSSTASDSLEPVTVTGDSYDGEAVEAWLDLMLELTEETPGFSPPVAARAFGYAGVSLYESVRFGIPEAQSLAGQVNGFDTSLLRDVEVSGEYDWRIVANANLAAIVRHLYPYVSAEQDARVDALEATLYERYAAQSGKEVAARSRQLGQVVAKRIAYYAASDGQGEAYLHNFPSRYTPPSGEGLWVPTPPGYQAAMQPYWGEVRPFLSNNIADTLPPPPPQYSMDPDSRFYREVIEVYDAVNELTSEELTIARFWSDGPGTTATPPGHSLSILRQVLAREDASLATAAEAFAKLGMGVHDAFVACWYAKYEYNLIRPITVIHEHIDPGFTIPLVTPPFPEYPSGHSVQSGAAAAILTDLFGDDYAFTDVTHTARTDMDGSPRPYDSFNDFADEAAISRLYGGIHYRAAIERGVTQGKEVGENINGLQLIR